jgi:DNA-binding CsgD family transcriptional regulator
MLMNPKPQFRAKPYNELDKSKSDRAQQLAQAEESIMTQLLQSGAPFVTPTEIAPCLGIKADSVRYHCRNCRAIKNWSASWRFFLDDAEHITALRAVVRVAVWSVKTLPESLQPKVH